MPNRHRLLEKRMKKFEEETGISIDELDRRYYERKAFYDNYMEFRLNYKPEKIGPGLWKSKCYNCGKEFVVKQYNYKNVGMICDDCKEHGQTCIICGKPIPYGKYVCNECWQKWGHVLPSVREGHKKQGKKLVGDKNPAKRDDVRKKLSESVKESYNKNPELRKSRAFVFSKSHGDENNMSGFERIIAEVLIEEGIPYKYEPMVDYGEYVRYPDFVIGETVAIEVAGYRVYEEEYRQKYYQKIRDYLKEFDVVIVVTYSDVVGEFIKEFEDNHRVEVIGIDNIDEDSLIRVGVEDITNVDYGHWISFHESKCHRYHWHTSWNISVFVKGYLRPGESMLIDFGELKKIVKEVVDELDHKILIREDFIKGEDGDYYEIVYDTDWMRRMWWPKREVVVIGFEPTAENISQYLANKILDRLPGNILEVNLIFREGTNNIAEAIVRRHLYTGKEIFRRNIRYWYTLTKYGSTDYVYEYENRKRGVMNDECNED